LQLQSLCDNWFSLPEQNWLKLNERYSFYVVSINANEAYISDFDRTDYKLLSESINKTYELNILYFKISIRPHIIDGLFVEKAVTISYQEPGYQNTFYWENERFIPTIPGYSYSSLSYVIVNGTKFKYKLWNNSIKIDGKEYIETKILFLCDKWEKEAKYFDLYKKGISPIKITSEKTIKSTKNITKPPPMVLVAWNAIGVISFLNKAQKLFIGKLTVWGFASSIIADFAVDFLLKSIIENIEITTNLEVFESNRYQITCLTSNHEFFIENLIDKQIVSCPDGSRVRVMLY
jgi:hypothetical protein